MYSMYVCRNTWNSCISIIYMLDHFMQTAHVTLKGNPNLSFPVLSTTLFHFATCFNEKCRWTQEPRKWKACNRQTQLIEPRPLRRKTNARFFVGTITAKKNNLVPAQRVPERITPVPHEWRRSRNLYASTAKEEFMQPVRGMPNHRLNSGKGAALSAQKRTNYFAR